MVCGGGGMQAWLHSGKQLPAMRFGVHHPGTAVARLGNEAETNAHGPTPCQPGDAQSGGKQTSLAH